MEEVVSRYLIPVISPATRRGTVAGRTSDSGLAARSTRRRTHAFRSEPKLTADRRQGLPRERLDRGPVLGLNPVERRQEAAADGEDIRTGKEILGVARVDAGCGAEFQIRIDRLDMLEPADVAGELGREEL